MLKNAALKLKCLTPRSVDFEIAGDLTTIIFVNKRNEEKDDIFKELSILQNIFQHV